MQVSSSVRWYSEGNEGIVLDLGTGRYFTLNNSGFTVWKALADGKDQSHCVAMLIELYKLDKPTAERDVAILLTKLVDFQLLTTTADQISEG